MLQLLIIIAYFLAIIGIGVWSRRRVGSRDGFFVASHGGTTLLITGSLLATCVGGSVTVGMAGLGYGQGLTGAWWLLVGSVGVNFRVLLCRQSTRGGTLYSPGAGGKTV